jgi:hypothetical protein
MTMDLAVRRSLLLRRLPAALALALGACSLPAADKQSDQIARTFYDELRTSADIDRDDHVDASLKTEDAKAEFAALRTWLPKTAPTTVKNTGWNYASSTGAGAWAQLAHAYVYSDRTIRVQTVMQKAPGQSTWSIIGFEAERDGAAEGPIIIGTPPRGASDLN